MVGRNGGGKGRVSMEVNVGTLTLMTLSWTSASERRRLEFLGWRIIFSLDTSLRSTVSTSSTASSSSSSSDEKSSLCNSNKWR